MRHQTERSTLAKLSQPKLFGVVHRDRLFTRLDLDRANRPAIWIAAPPGAGKTALAASYLEARELRAIWYQVDSSDSDPATFFYYLGLAGKKAAGRKHLLLPLLTPEYLSDLAGFTRRFFRKLFASIPVNTILVLDNYQEIASASALHSVIQEAIAELPNGINLLVISRVIPPPQFARAVANNLIGLVGWEDLRLTLEETRAVAAAAGLPQYDEETLLSLQDQTHGWAAGLVLMMERLRTTGVANHISQSETMESVFNYFASQIFDQASPEMREFLMRTAILSHVTVNAAITLSGSLQAKELLDYLYRRRLFIDRRHGDQISYQYHALFREFLLIRAGKHFLLPELLNIKREAGRLAEQGGDIEAAAGLYAETEEWQELIRMISKQASALLAQGRNQILQQLIDLLPQQVINTAPWIFYWRGISYLLFNSQLAKSDLERAYAGFQVESDSAGLFLSCGGMLDAYFYAEDDMKPAMIWAEHLQQLLGEHGDFPSNEIELKVLASLQGLIFAAPHHPLLELLGERVERALQSTAEPSLRVAIACAAIWLPLWRGDSCKSRKIIDEIKPLLNSVSVSPMFRILWRNIEGCYAWSTTLPHHVSEQKFREALQIAQEAGISAFNCMLWGDGVYAALAAGNAKAGRSCLEQLEMNLGIQRKHEVAQFKFLRAGVEILEENLQMALDDATAALKLQEELGRPYLIETAGYGRAQILVEKGDMEIARQDIAKAIEYARVMKNPLFAHQCLLVEAYSWLKQGEAQKALKPLREGLRIGRENDFLFLDFW